jgi:hypothetical protein
MLFAGDTRRNGADAISHTDILAQNLAAQRWPQNLTVFSEASGGLRGSTEIHRPEMALTVQRSDFAIIKIGTREYSDVQEAR